MQSSPTIRAKHKAPANRLMSGNSFASLVQAGCAVKAPLPCRFLGRREKGKLRRRCTVAKDPLASTSGEQREVNVQHSNALIVQEQFASAHAFGDTCPVRQLAERG